MSNATEKTAIVNMSLLSVGQNRITDLTATDDVNANKYREIFEKMVKELVDDDWLFNRARVQLTQVHKLTVDTAPTDSEWAAGATLTGAVSLVTCTVYEKLSSKVYLVSEPSDDFTDGEVISDGTNSVDCATDYPEVDDTPNDFGTWDYMYYIPADCLRIRGLCSEYFDDARFRYAREGKFLLSNQTEAFLLYNKLLEASAGVSDVTLMPQWFHRLISARLSYILSTNITENQKIRTKAEIEWKEAYQFAKEQNGDEAYSEFEEPDPSWADGAFDIMNTL